MAWYTHDQEVTHTHTYPNRTAASEDAQKAAAHGWRVDSEEPFTPPVDDRLMSSGGGTFTFFAGLRQPGEITVTFVRTSDWLESPTEA